MKKLSLLLAGCALVMGLAGCAAKTGSGAADTSSAAVMTSGGAPSKALSSAEASSSGVVESPDLSPTKDLSVTREGQTETLPAHLETGTAGYYIYMLDDFALAPSDDGDIIRPKADSDLLQTIYMRIARSDGSASLPADSQNSDGIVIKYQRITKGNSVFDVEMGYPAEAAEGGAVLLGAMLDTLNAQR